MKRNPIHDDAKVIIQFVSACIIILVGIVLIFLGFYAVPVGEISASVLTAIGECFTFAGSLWSIERTYDYKTKKIERYVYDRERKEDEEEGE